MEFLKMALNADFLLFILGIFWLNISGYIQERISECNPNLFGFASAIAVYLLIHFFVS